MFLKTIVTSKFTYLFLLILTAIFIYFISLTIQKPIQSSNYVITTPANYIKEIDPKTADVKYKTPTMNPEKTLSIHTELTQLHNPCEQIPPLYPNAECVIINGYQALDLGSHKPPFLMNLQEYSYIFTHNGKLYHLTFSNMTEQEKNSILSTFRLK